MIILGIDPGYGITGYGVVSSEKGNFKALDYGVIKTPADISFPKRLLMIEDGITQLIEKYKPDQLSIEELFFSKNVTTGIAVAEARGVVLVTAEKLLSGNVFEYTPNQIKQALTGTGSADKRQMQIMTKILLNLREVPKPDDAADALAVALCHAQTGRLGSLFQVK